MEPNLAANGYRANRVRLIAALLLCAINLCAASEAKHHFEVASNSEFVAVVDMGSAGADWGKRGSEAAVAAVSLDGKLHQHVMLFAGARQFSYRLALGSLAPGGHDLSIVRDPQSATGTLLEVGAIRIEEIAPTHAEYDVHANAPILFARANTIGKFSDIPLLLYCERLQENGASVLQYTVIFSNEDGGTSTRALMSRWGRATDIEYVYKRFVQSGKATVQGPNHVETEFGGALERSHPLLMPVTDNNMIAAASDSPLRFRLVPILVDLSKSSRETVMDRYPITYEVMAKELAREGKLRTFGTVVGENIGEPRNYLYIDYSATLMSAAISVSVRMKNGQTFSSDLGRLDYAIARTGHVRTTIELPEGATKNLLDEIRFECRVAPPARNAPIALAGSCILHTVSKMFQLKVDYTPADGFWQMQRQITIPTGQGISFGL